MFQIAAKAEKLLQEILSANKLSKLAPPSVKQEPQVQPIANVSVPQTPQFNPPVQPSNQYYSPASYCTQQQQQQQIINTGYYGYPPPNQPVSMHPGYYMRHPPPSVPIQQPYYYTQSTGYYSTPLTGYTTAYPSQQAHLIQQPPVQYGYMPPVSYAPFTPPNSTNPLYRKRKFGEINNYNTNNINNNNNNYRFKQPVGGFSKSSTSSGSSQSGGGVAAGDPLSDTGNEDDSAESPSLGGAALNEEEDLNLMRERELKDLKCKSVVEKMSVFLKYYQQFKEAYIHRVHTIECSDSLKIQFHSLIKYLNEYEALLAELDMMITEHERDHCKNNHRKTKKFFNKTKAFIRYECNKRLQSNIFEYRRLINSQDRYAGMYDLLDMNSYLISLLPDIGVSIRRYINRCEKAREQAQLELEEEEDTFQAQWHSENSNDSNTNDDNPQPTSGGDLTDLTIPSFKEYVAAHGDEDDLLLNSDLLMSSGEKENTTKREEASGNERSGSGGSHRAYESFSMGVDSLNRYLLKRVEDEETLDELVKERIIKWINKRQAKYILIFSEVDKLLNQHKAGECYPKFHSYLLFNLGKLVTVCDSYHQKLKELLYSTTIRRKKKRKKVKLLPEAMADVFDEINDLKRALEYAKIAVKKCNEYKTALGKQMGAQDSSTSFQQQ